MNAGLYLKASMILQRLTRLKLIKWSKYRVKRGISI